MLVSFYVGTSLAKHSRRIEFLTYQTQLQRLASYTAEWTEGVFYVPSLLF
jgi:hypothetical protein